MSEPTDLTVHILREIRDEIIASRHESNRGLELLRQDLGARIDVTNDRVERVEHALLDLATQQRFIVRSFDTLARRDRRLEEELGELRGRLEVVEHKLSSG